jgi:hypothetical protein
MNLADLAGGILGFLLTLFIFSYILGDNPLFRLTTSLFIGVSAGFAGIVAINSVLLPRLVAPLFSNSFPLIIRAVIPLILALLLMAKLSPWISSLGSIPMAYLVGVGAAAAIGGVVLGTLFPQVNSSMNLFDLQVAIDRGINVGFFLVNGGIILVGTITSLAYFHFGARHRQNQAPVRQPWIEELSQIGQLFIAITLGVFFAAVYSAALAALVERLSFLVDFLRILLSSFISS